ncbi:aspartate aminotransferase family protein [Pseudomaricurvus alkylphenolicus]|uniref:pyridoxal phosphate-dependent decarboxylase family protein n=1 Tax=Pseudomaricurvus alkylphenolicus TaxID=1306991 RepID=UPI00141F82CB|nr:aminotransferase class V-fold PLP-dependent enzyme [Pseudomaricurvus alkylphenolicus]NIB39893.1 aspartate aminotransferase family protein [Pseudomaricurvus alkylphenolicus]
MSTPKPQQTRAKLYQLPPQGSNYDTVMGRVRELRNAMTEGQRGKLASTTFQGQEEMQRVLHDAFGEFMDWNGLFTFQEAPAARLENDVIDICVDIMNGGEQGRGNLTSGGTESNFNALHAMRKWAREAKPHITEPEIVAPYSTHSTVHKTAKYLDLKVVTVPQLADLSADVEGLAKAIGPNTIGIVGSAPNWPYGTVDPIEAFGQLALKHDLWLHVDACVGGYILPFFRELGVQVPAYDFSVEGVNSISADLHKYGYAPKPCSSVLWRSQREQGYHYMPITEWACGLYLSQGFVGSRTLGPVAGIWALMHYWGKQGYLDNARRILHVKNAIIDQCQRIEGLTTWPTDGPLLMIAADGFNIELVVGGMEERGWRLLGVNNPPAIHLTLDVMEEDYLQKFLVDLKEVVDQIRCGELNSEGLLSYGGVGAVETAPKWLLSAVEIFEQQSPEK